MMGAEAHADRALRTDANGTATGRASVTVQNQLSGVTSSQFNRASSFARPDGVKYAQTTAAPVLLTTPTTTDVIDELSVASKTYTISQVPNSNVWINNALITWTYNSHGIPKTIIARMQFTYDEGCLYELYSAQLPAYNADLVAVSGKN